MCLQQISTSRQTLLQKVVSLIRGLNQYRFKILKSNSVTHASNWKKKVVILHQKLKKLKFDCKQLVGRVHQWRVWIRFLQSDCENYDFSDSFVNENSETQIFKFGGGVEYRLTEMFKWQMIDYLEDQLSFSIYTHKSNSFAKGVQYLWPTERERASRKIVDELVNNDVCEFLDFCNQKQSISPITQNELSQFFNKLLAMEKHVDRLKLIDWLNSNTTEPNNIIHDWEKCMNRMLYRHNLKILKSNGKQHNLQSFSCDGKFETYSLYHLNSIVGFISFSIDEDQWKNKQILISENFIGHKPQNSIPIINIESQHIKENGDGKRCLNSILLENCLVIQKLKALESHHIQFPNQNKKTKVISKLPNKHYFVCYRKLKNGRKIRLYNVVKQKRLAKHKKDLFLTSDNIKTLLYLYTLIKNNNSKCIVAKVDTIKFPTLENRRKTFVNSETAAYFHQSLGFQRLFQYEQLCPTPSKMLFCNGIENSVQPFFLEEKNSVMFRSFPRHIEIACLLMKLGSVLSKSH